jgi:hypothetical protein
MYITNLSLIIVILGSSFLSYFELTSALYINSKNNLEKSISQSLPELKFLSQSEKKNKINSLIEKTTSSTSPLFNFKKNHALGRLLLLSGLETNLSDEKLNQICNAREELIIAAQSSPRKIEYQLSIADIESISSSLISTCDSLKNSAKKSISLSERLQWVEYLAPNDPPTLYKKGIIERSIGARIEAMRSFRKFEENSLSSQEEYRRFIMSQAQTDLELEELLPRKYPNLLNWIAEYEKNPNPNIEYKLVFEKVFLELISNLTNDKKINSKESLEMLYKMYWFQGIQYSEAVKESLIKLIFKIASLHSSETFAKDFFGSLINQKKIPILISRNFSSISKKSSQIYNWTSHKDLNLISLDLKSESLGIFLPANSKTEKMIIQGGKGDKNIHSLKSSIWTSDDNITFTQSENIKSTRSGIIDSRPIAIFNLPELNAKYIKIFFSLESDKIQKLNSPTNLIVQLYTKQ